MNTPRYADGVLSQNGRRGLAAGWLAIILTGGLAVPPGVLALDVDGDGLSDVFERRFGGLDMQPGADDDSDGFTNLAESLFGSDPLDAQSPGSLPRLLFCEDGLVVSWRAEPFAVYQLETSPDLREWSASGDPIVGDGLVVERRFPLTAAGNRMFFRLRASSPSDSDVDGLDDREEWLLGTDPNRADTDGDGMADGLEMIQGTDPLRAEPPVDTDGDGLSDEEEMTAHTDPGNPDTDDDGLPDGWEVRNALNPLANDAWDDGDGDGVANFDEFTLGTDPRDFANCNGGNLKIAPYLGEEGRLFYDGSLLLRVTDLEGHKLPFALVTIRTTGSQNRISQGGEKTEAATLRANARGLLVLRLVSND
jgi:hypothetical protein